MRVAFLSVPARSFRNGEVCRDVHVYCSNTALKRYGPFSVGRAVTRMNATESSSDQSERIDQEQQREIKTTGKSDDELEDERLQQDKRYVFREFSKVTIAACGIGLVLFCFDILISLVALTLGGLYAIAVLFNIRFATEFVARVGVSCTSFGLSLRNAGRQLWARIRHRVLIVSKD